MAFSILPQQLPYSQMLTKWASILNPLLKNPALDSLILENVTLVTGSNVINHKLGRPLQGFKVTRMRSNFAEIYDTQDSNQMPQLTLNLNASAGVVIDLEVF